MVIFDYDTKQVVREFKKLRLGAVSASLILGNFLFLGGSKLGLINLENQEHTHPELKKIGLESSYIYSITPIISSGTIWLAMGGFGCREISLINLKNTVNANIYEHLGKPNKPFY